LAIDLNEREMAISYSVNNGQSIDFFVPGRNQNFRWATHSVSTSTWCVYYDAQVFARSQCNGFSAGVNTDLFRAPGFQSGYDPVWMDLLYRHGQQPFHALVGGGDQLYCDAYVPQRCIPINHGDAHSGR
jgi:hypothetical protein